MNTVAMLDRMLRYSLLIGGAAIVLSLVAQSRRLSIGVTLGVIITCANFGYLCWTFRRRLKAKIEHLDLRWHWRKTMVLIAVLMVAIIKLDVSPVGVAAGYAVLIPSLILGGWPANISGEPPSLFTK